MQIVTNCGAQANKKHKQPSTRLPLEAHCGTPIGNGNHTLGVHATKTPFLHNKKLCDCQHLNSHTKRKCGDVLTRVELLSTKNRHKFTTNDHTMCLNEFTQLIPTTGNMQKDPSNSITLTNALTKFGESQTSTWEVQPRNLNKRPTWHPLMKNTTKPTSANYHADFACVTCAKNITWTWRRNSQPNDFNRVTLLALVKVMWPPQD